MEGRGERGQAFGDVEGGRGQQDAQGLRAVLGGGDHLDVVGPGLLVAAPDHAPGPVVRQFGAAQEGLADRFPGGAVAGFAVGGATAARADGEPGHHRLLACEEGVVAPPVPGFAEVEPADDGLADVVDAEGGLLVPPGLLDIGRVDVDGGDGGVRRACAAVVVVDDPGVVPLVVGGDLVGDDDPVQGGASADAGAAAARAGRGVLFGTVAGADVAAVLAHPPEPEADGGLVGRALAYGAEIEAVDDVPVAADVVGVARG